MKRTSSWRLPVPCLLLVCICAASAAGSCGRKGEPTLKAQLAPAPVIEFRALQREESLVLRWAYPQSDRKGVTGFSLEKAGPAETAQGEAPPFRGVGGLSADASEFIDRDVLPGMTYRYRIRAVSARGVPGEASKDLTVTPREAPPAPAGLSYDVRPEGIEISWQPREGARYLVYRSAEREKVASAPLGKSPVAEPRFRDAAPVDRAMYYAVRTILDHEIVVEGKISGELAVPPEALIPVSPRGLRYVPLPKGVQLFWDENPETWVQGYRVYRKRATEQDFSALGDAVIPGFRDDEALSVRTHYLVTARGPVKESRGSSSIEAVPVEER